MPCVSLSFSYFKSRFQVLKINSSWHLCQKWHICYTKHMLHIAYALCSMMISGGFWLFFKLCTWLKFSSDSLSDYVDFPVRFPNCHCFLSARSGFLSLSSTENRFLYFSYRFHFAYPFSNKPWPVSGHLVCQSCFWRKLFSALVDGCHLPDDAILFQKWRDPGDYWFNDYSCQPLFRAGLVFPPGNHAFRTPASNDPCVGILQHRHHCTSLFYSWCMVCFLPFKRKRSG